MVEQHLILISRDDLLTTGGLKIKGRLLRVLGRLSRQGFSLLITAPQPDKWSGKQEGPDNVLIGSESIRTQLSDAGGMLDGIYYVPRSLMTQRRNREEAFRDIMERYGIDAGHVFLFSSSRKWAEMALQMGIQATYLNSGKDLVEELKKLLADI